MALQPGDPSPDFTLPTTAGGQVSLASLRGKKVVLYFYPKDQTPGCTVEACDFRDAHVQLQRAGAVVLGVSRDSIGSHGRFREKYKLPFDLLTDEDAKVSTAFGAYGKKLMYGKEVIGTIRSTFVIDEAGKLAAVFPKVKVAGHAAEVLAALRAAPEAQPAAKAKAPKAKAPKAKAPKVKAPKAKAPKAKASKVKAAATRAKGATRR